MRQPSTGMKSRIKEKAAQIFLFSYAVIVGTSVPLLLSRCSTSCTSCGSCAVLALGLLPLALFVKVKGRISRSIQRIASLFRRGEGKTFFRS